uniref:Uncharacterized protein n=1 Tax=Anguilla anguilla TaxID=7936 RepID=A0A0E9T3C3_ANGAN
MKEQRVSSLAFSLRIHLWRLHFESEAHTIMKTRGLTMAGKQPQIYLPPKFNLTEDVIFPSWYELHNEA